MSTPDLDENQLREKAYMFWLEEGQPEGRADAHWSKAIDALTPAQPKRKARKAAPKKGIKSTAKSETKKKTTRSKSIDK